MAEPTFEVLLTGAEIEALLGAVEPDSEELSSAWAKLAQAFTTVESAGGC